MTPGGVPAGPAEPGGRGRRAGPAASEPVAGGLTGYSPGRRASRPGRRSSGRGQRTIPFYGAHQAGIVTPAQDRLAFATLNVVDGTSRPTCATCCRSGRPRPRG